MIGPKKTYRFFFQWRKAKGTACFIGGILLVLYGWAMVGLAVEGWGFLNLFGDFFPTALCASRPPYAGCALDAPASNLPRPILSHPSCPLLLRTNLTCAIAHVCRGFLRNMPIIGNFLSWSPVRKVTDRFFSKSRLPV